MSGKSLRSVWEVSEGCLGGVLGVFLGGVREVSGECLGSVWGESGKCLGGV